MRHSVKQDRFIPIRKMDLIQACLDDEKLPDTDANAFKSLCKLMVATIHYQYHETLELLKDDYAPFDPNSDTLHLSPDTREILSRKQASFSKTFAEVLNSANFERITEQDLQDALKEASLFKVRLAVEFDDFSEMVFYRRGEYQKTETIVKYWGLKKELMTFTNYDKVAIYIKYKDAAYFEHAKRSTPDFEPSSTIIKLFQNVPKADLEMLFPNSEVRMRTLDKAIIGGSAIIGGGIMLVTKLGASILLLAGVFAYWFGLSDKQVTIGTQELLALGIGTGVLGAFIFKEWSKFKNRKLKFMKALADNLYFKNLDNNAGVFHHLIDAAEEEECKEMIIAYYFLATSKYPLSSEQLDTHVEDWFSAKFDFNIDFEIDDALAKLTHFGLVSLQDNKYEALNIEDAHQKLDHRWDDLFS